MRTGKIARANRDLPQLESSYNALAALGGGGDYEQLICAVPDLSVGASSGTVGYLPSNTMTVRNVTFTFAAAVTGAAASFSMNLVQRRLGLLLVNTTAPTTVVSGATVITPAAMANITAGMRLVFAGGTGATETVVVQSTTATTFTATFANNHSGAYAITSAPLVTLAFLSTVNAVAFKPITVNAWQNYILPGDTLSVTRVTISTGLATPAVLTQIDWVDSGSGGV